MISFDDIGENIEKRVKRERRKDDEDQEQEQEESEYTT